MVFPLKKLGSVLGAPALLFYTLPMLIVILVVGTIAQKWVGLHLALETYFYSWIIWKFFLPLPGGLLVMSAITLNLSFKFLLHSRWVVAKVGTNLIHLGILILMIGGLGTIIFKQDGVIVLPPERPAQMTQAYTETDFVIFKNEEYLQRISFDDVHVGYNIESLPFDLTILETCRSCRIELRPDHTREGWIGAAGSMMLVDAPAPLKAEETMQGLSFEVKGLDNAQDGKYLTFESFPKPPQFQFEGDTYKVVIERHRTRLPFTLTLNEFRAEYYPGTLRAKDYISDVTVTDGAQIFDAVITMNEPLRHAGYTFYQSSFIEDSSVLAVVKNRASLFPYISSLIVALGLFIHLILLLRQRR